MRKVAGLRGLASLTFLPLSTKLPPSDHQSLPTKAAPVGKKVRTKTGCITVSRSRQGSLFLSFFFHLTERLSNLEVPNTEDQV